MAVRTRVHIQHPTLSLCSDPAVGAEPGETEPGPVPAAVLSVQPAGQRAPKPQEPPRCGQPALQEHAGTPGSLLRVLLPCPGKNCHQHVQMHRRALRRSHVEPFGLSSGVQSRRGVAEEPDSVRRTQQEEGPAVLPEGSGWTEETQQGRQRPHVPGNTLHHRSMLVQIHFICLNCENIHDFTAPESDWVHPVSGPQVFVELLQSAAEV